MKKIIIILGLFTLSGEIYSQAPPNKLSAKSVVDNFNRFVNEFPQEKYFLHLGKNYYSPGEVVWFKLYQVDAFNNKPRSLSQVAKLQLIDQSRDSLIAEYPVKTEEGAGHGSIVLPDNLVSGNYTLRVFNNWMLNFDHELIHDQVIYVAGRTEGEISKEQGLEKAGIDIQFFPESGHYLNGVTSRIAFKAVGADGYGLDVEGTIVDQSGKVIQFFRSQKFGMGSFYMKAEQGNVYKAKIVGTDSSVVEVPLPVADDSGYSFSTFDNRNLIRVSIFATPDRYGDSTLLVLSSSGKVYFTAASKSTKKPSIVVFDRTKLPPGIALITLFDLETGIPVSERLIFNDDPEPGNLSIATTKERYKTKEKVTAAIKLDGFKEVNGAIASATVYQNTGSIIHNDQSSIVSDLLLSSELKGFIEQPSYYFDRNQPEAKRALDNLLLTQGWRRFDWRQITSGKFINVNHLLERDGFLLEGRLLDGDSKEVLKNQEITITSTRDPGIFYPAFTDAEGQFKLYNLSWNGYQELTFKINDTLSSTTSIDIEINQSRVDKPQKTIRIEKSPWGQFEKQIEVKGKINRYYKTPQYTEVSDTTELRSFYGIPDRVVRLDDYIAMPNSEEVFRELLIGVRLRDRDGSPEIRVIEQTEDLSDKTRSREYSDKPPLLFVDNVRVFNEEILTNMIPNQVDHYEIVYSRNKKYQYLDLNKDDDREFSGLLAVFMKPEFINQAGIKGLITVRLNGYPGQREYYAPTYSSPQADRIPDFREVLLWNPQVEFDQNGEAIVEFYTSDITGTFSLSVNGITNSGKPFNSNFQFEVGSIE